MHSYKFRILSSLIVLLTLPFSYAKAYTPKRIVTLERDADIASVLHSKNTRYIIKYDYNLAGKNVTIGDDSVLEFQNGSIYDTKGSGSMIFSNTTLSGCPKIFGCKFAGNLSNAYVEIDWFLDGNELYPALNYVGNLNVPIHFGAHKYTLSDDIAVGGYVHWYGDNTTIVLPDVAHTTKYGAIVLGVRKIGEKYTKNTVSGIIENLSFDVYTTNKKIQGVLVPVKYENLTISNCIIRTHGRFPVSNAAICSKNNGNVLNGVYRRINLTVDNCVIDFRDSEYGECEAIGIAEGFDGVKIQNNRIYRTFDDVGLHYGRNVHILNNYIDSYDGRITFNNVENVWIENNIIEYNDPTTNGMGIFVGEKEYDNADTLIFNRHYKILNNIVDYRNGASRPNYGIRVAVSEDLTIAFNTLITKEVIDSNGVISRYGGVIEISEWSSRYAKTMKNVMIYGNICEHISSLRTEILDRNTFTITNNTFRTAAGLYYGNLLEDNHIIGMGGEKRWGQSSPALNYNEQGGLYSFMSYGYKFWNTEDYRYSYKPGDWKSPNLWVDANGRTYGKLSGTTADIPKLQKRDAGYEYFNTDLNKPLYWSGSIWVDASGYQSIGSSNQRPASVYDGFKYYDSTIKKVIVWNGTQWRNL